MVIVLKSNYYHFWLTWLTGSFSWPPADQHPCRSSIGGHQLMCIKL